MRCLRLFPPDITDLQLFVLSDGYVGMPSPRWKQIEWLRSYNKWKGLFRPHPAQPTGSGSLTGSSAVELASGLCLPDISIGSPIRITLDDSDYTPSRGTPTTSQVYLDEPNDVISDWERDIPVLLTGSFVRRDSSGYIISGTLPGLTELLLDFDNNDVHSRTTYKKVLICSYKSFGVSSQQLLHLLLYQCGKKLRFAKVEQQIALYYSLGEVLEIWLDMSIVEYHVEERPLLRRMREVAVFLRSKTKSHRFEKLIQTIDERCHLLHTLPESLQPQSTLGDLSTASIEVSQRTLSDALNVVFFWRYRIIKQAHYMEYIFSNKDNSVGLFLRDCRKMETWVKKAILRPHSHAERTSILEYFLTTVQECRRSGNYASARAIYNGILHFKTLKRTFGNLNKKMSQVFKEEEGLLSSYSYETSVDAVSHCIPCLEIHVKEMETRFRVTRSNFRENHEFINFEGCREVYACISKLPNPSFSFVDADNIQDKRAIELVLTQLHNIIVDDRLIGWINRRTNMLRKEELIDYQARWHELRKAGFNPTHTQSVQADLPPVHDVACTPPRRLNPFDRQSPMCLDGQITNVTNRPVDGGGNADIYMGEYQGRNVAIKALRPWSSSSVISETRLLNRIRREYTTWTWVSHPLVLPCLGYYFSDFSRDLPALVSPWMANGSFDKYSRGLDGLGRLKVLVEIAEGLCYLHEYFQPIVHGDIRAGNILISDDGRPCLSDFGLSSVLREEGLTATTEHAGSLAWMSPELLQHQGVPAIPTTYSDVWAYAMTILEVMTGMYPYSPIKGPGDLMEKVIHNILPPKPKDMGVPKALSNKIWSLCQKCWVAEPQQRLTMSQVYQTMRDFC